MTEVIIVTMLYPKLCVIPISLPIKSVIHFIKEKHVQYLENVYSNDLEITTILTPNADF